MNTLEFFPAPDPKMPFSLAVRVGDMLYLSGQIGQGPDGKLVGSGIAAETRQTLENIKRTLDALRQIRPKWVAPMHYRIPNLRLDVADAYAFASRYPADTTTFVAGTSIERTRESLPSEMRVVVLRALANEG